MRLKHIKLSGFKSFVDPTHVNFPSHLSGVVGPNGCGKSNIIDAVRWVMGESSAKHLRGESIADVIFNGTTGRQPVGQASVELTFDNTFGKLPGEYSSYNELAIRRVVNRDGQSIYFLNNTRCRRRDIMDIFRGTGLGPRSYAIIEQGMISRLIEAKPEELRNYLEEAAGITKYKDRRRETELRIEHTKANLSRLSDLREELGNQLEKLQRQAKAAEKYKELKDIERQQTAELYALRWQVLNAEIKQQQQQASQLLLNYERLTAEHTRSVSQIEQVRVTYADFNEQLQACQAEYYSATAEVSRAEQEITHLKQRQQTLQADFQEAKQNFQTAQALTETDTATINRCKTALLELEPKLGEQQTVLSAAQEKLQLAEKEFGEAQQAYDVIVQKVAEHQKQDELLKVQIQHAEEQIAQCEQRISKLQTELETLNYKELSGEKETLETQIAEKTAAAQQLTAEIENKTTLLNQQQQQNQQARLELHQLRTTMHQLQGQHSSLLALQKAALGQDNKTLTEWIEQNDLHQKPRLAEGLQVNSPWELAVECVLSKFLPAVVVNDLQTIATADAAKLPGQLSLYVAGHEQEKLHNEEQHPNWTPLRKRINTDWPLLSLLAGIYCADNLTAALEQREKLQPYESLVTPEGIWVGKNWLHVYQADVAQTGIISRQQLLTELEQEIDKQTTQVDRVAEKLEQGEQQLVTLDQDREQLRSTYQQQQNQQMHEQKRLQEIVTKVNHQQQREATINQELTEQRNQIENLAAKLTQWNTDYQNVGAMQAQIKTAQEQHYAQKEQLRELTLEARSKVDNQREEFHNLSVQTNALKSELNATTANLARIEQQLADLTHRQQHLQENINAINEPLSNAEKQLKSILETQLTAEQKLAGKRDQLADVEKQLRQLEQLQHAQAQSMEDARNELEGARVAQATTEARCANITEQLNALEVKVADVLAQMAPEATETVWAEELEATIQRIKRLGAINLAAIEEYAEASERKQYLDAQNDDVQQALNTLEEAIQKIDQETRATFKQTYNTINEHLKELFPKIFGGGEAYLELTEDDVLSAGVRIIARPPGKKNSSIHLLSGGEKALTAIALVFSFFNLQPSPFCMLDEVDAPLDDANVGRFCKMVSEMSKKVQFIVITHNKITMEMTEHLTGVTMREPGVSRLVSVNVEEAAALAVS
jgi:chromosome segregation protein